MEPGFNSNSLVNILDSKQNALSRKIAEFGIAAHWKNKDPKIVKIKDTKEYRWMHDLLELMDNSSSQDELIENSKIKLFQDNFDVVSPKGDVIELPKNIILFSLGLGKPILLLSSLYKKSCFSIDNISCP